MLENLLTYRIAFSTPWFSIEESISNHGAQPYYRLTGPDGVIILPLTVDGDILMVRQFRHSIGRETLELPAGSIEPKENILDAALREVQEETAYTCTKIIQLVPGHLYLNRTTHVEYFCMAIDAYPVPGAIVEEGIIPEIITRKNFRHMILEDRIEQIAALCFIGLVSVKLGVDLLESSIDTIKSHFYTKIDKKEL